MLGSQKPALSLGFDPQIDPGVTYIGVPSCGLRKRTPSSVTCASFSRETIWKLRLSSAVAIFRNVDVMHALHYLSPVSFPCPPHDCKLLAIPVKMLCGHDCSLCAPPIASSVFCPGLRPLSCLSYASGYGFPRFSYR